MARRVAWGARPPQRAGDATLRDTPAKAQRAPDEPGRAARRSQERGSLHALGAARRDGLVEQLPDLALRDPRQARLLASQLALLAAQIALATAEGALLRA